MNIPRPLYPTNTNPLTHWQDFALCFECHDRYQVLSENVSDVSQTNFWNEDSNTMNSHNIHLGIYSNHFDSDWDLRGTEYAMGDSSESCIACHNVHGSPTRAMIRHGELISSYSSTVSTATWTTPDAFPGGTYYVYARWTEGSSRASNARYSINYDGGSDVVYKDQRAQGGQWVLLGTYPFGSGNCGSVVLDNKNADGSVIADAIGWDSDGALDPDPEVIADNPNATTSGDWWFTSTSVSGYYGDNYQYQVKMMDKLPALNFAYLVPTDFETAIWRPNMAQAGDYDVYAWWNEGGSARSTNTPYTIYYDGGSETIRVNQESSSAGWYYLGTYYFAAGTSGCVVVSDDANGIVIADAVGWDGDLDGQPDIIIDNGAPEFQYVGAWTCNSGVSGAYDDDLCWKYEYGPQPDPEATLAESVGGRFSYSGAQLHLNGVCRACHGALSYLRTPNLNPQVIYSKAEPEAVDVGEGSQDVLLTATVVDPDDNLDSVTVDLLPIDGSATQAMYDDGTQGDVTSGDKIYTYQATVPQSTIHGENSLLVTATDLDGLTGKNSIVMTVTNPSVLVVDNVDGSFAGSWPTSTSVSGYYGDNYQYHDPGSGTDTFTWTPTISILGTYEVFGRWTEGANRAPDATYTVYHDGGSTPVSVNQRSNGGTWVSLGTYYFNGTGDYVEMGESPNGYVIADAIKWVLQP